MHYPWHLYLMALLYVLAGINHFIKPKMYVRIMPNYLPAPITLTYISGVAEIVGGIGLCFAKTKNIAIVGIIVMLIIFFTVHFYMLRSKKAGAGIPQWILIIRIPLQFLLIYWAYSYYV
ncbi:MauE/DoxX family redox-associated membrane protein [Zhouia sp. PK063]|uniref:DoxX family protein n=1 Tax=Zhouia sp. PK063 TaxID=3373602 RepID=UPI0037AAA6C3